MTRLNKVKSSKYIVYVGNALTFYCDSLNDVNNVKFAYGGYSVKVVEL